MNRFVLDASVAAAWCLADEHSERALAVLERLRMDEALVPSLWPTEIANILLVAERRRRITSADSARAIELLLSLPIRIVPEPATTTLHEVRQMARAHNLSTYDATYLRLARDSGLPLATLDEALILSAKREGIVRLR